LCRIVVRHALNELKKNSSKSIVATLYNAATPVIAGCKCYLNAAADAGLYAYGNMDWVGGFESNRFCLSKLNSDQCSTNFTRLSKGIASLPSFFHKYSSPTDYARDQIIFSTHELKETERCRDLPRDASWRRYVRSLELAPPELQTLVGHLRDIEDRPETNEDRKSDLHQAEWQLALGSEMSMENLEKGRLTNDLIRQAEICSLHNSEETCTGDCEWLVAGRGNCILSKDKRIRYRNSTNI